MPPISSSLFWRLKLMKFVSMSTRYGGTRASLCCRNNEEATWVLWTGCQCKAELRSPFHVHSTLCLLLRLLLFLLLFQLVLLSKIY